MMKIKIMGLVNRWRTEFHQSRKSSTPSLNKSARTNEKAEKLDIVGVGTKLNDTGLLSRVINLWNQADLQSIIDIDFSRIEAEAHRAIVLLIVAASQQRLGNHSEFKCYALLAFEWAEDKKVIKNILLSEAWLQLGLCSNSAKLLSDSKAQIEKAMKLTPFESNILKTFELNHDRSEVEIASSHEFFIDSRIATSSSSRAPLETAISIEQNLIKLSEKIDNQNSLMFKSTEEIKASVKSELENNTHQIEAFLDLQNFFNHGRHLPKMHGWPISPDLALYLVDLINSNSYNVVIEFGSGTSTSLIAQALDLKSRSNGENALFRQVAFEHLPEYYEKTSIELKKHGLDKKVDLELTPLKLADFVGSSYSYYSCDDVLRKLSAELPMGNPKVLVLVDGPPARTGKHARFPALPVLLHHFSGADIDIVLDDFARKEEKGVVNLWIALLEQNEEYTYTLDSKRMEKDACLISIRNSNI